MDINSVVASELNKNAAVNTFTRGMNTDAADNLMPSDQYRLAKNLRLVANEGGNGELRLIEGARNIMTPFEDEIVATTQIRDFGIVITGRRSIDDNNKPFIDKWSIWRFNVNHPQSKLKIFGTCTEKMGPAFSLVTRYEDDDNIKLYIADGKHPLMYIRIDEVPSPISTDINYILSSPAHNFGGFDSFINITGSLKSAAVQYAYVLYNKYGNSSNLSPLSQLKPITTNITKGTGIRTGVYYNNTGSVGFLFDIKEDKTSGFEKIKVFRITYEQVGQDPKVDMIIDDDLNDNTNYTVNDTGNFIVNYSYSEFLGLLKTMIVPKEIESKGDYLFASNVSYQIGNNQDIVTKFSNLDLSCLITDSNYTNMNASFNSSWESNTGTYSSFQLLRDSSIQKSLRRDEIYRYGIVLYDIYGNAWPVKFLCDLRTPPINGNDSRTLSKLEVRFTIKWNKILSDFTQDFVDFFTSFEIVRCKRNPEDRFTLTQGIVGRVLECRKYNTVQDELTLSGGYYTVNPSTTSTNMLCPSGFMTTDRLVVYPTLNVGNDPQVVVDRTFAVSSKDVVLFASPEVCYQQDDVLNLINTYKSDLQILAVWQTRGLNTTGKRYFTMYTEYNADVIFNKAADDSIEGLTFLRRKGYFNSRFLQESNHQGSLWISSRLARDVHEPLGYNQRYDADSEHLWEYYTSKNGSTIKTSYDVDDTGDDAYFRSPNNVKLRKTIYNKFDNGFSGATTFNWTICPSAKQNSIGIQDVKNVNIPRYDGFESGTTFTFKNNATNILSYTFVPWSVPTFINLQYDNFGGDDPWFNLEWGGHVDFVNSGYETSVDYPISAVGKSLIIKTSEDWFNDLRSSQSDINLAITVCNIRKTNTIPYGGYTDYAREHSIYYSFGDYAERSGSNQNITVTSGDCFIQDFRYNAAKTFYTPESRCALNMSTLYIVPIESDIDMDNEVGWSSKYNSAEDARYILDEAASFRGYIQTEPCYQANTAYNNNQTAKYFTGTDKDSLRDINYDCRVCCSNQKSNNEFIDSWLTFKSANYIDVDSRYGQITNLRLFKDTLLFWQEQAAGVLSVNERTMLQDANDTNIILGNGSILQRYDYLTTQYGMKPDQFVDGQSNTTLYWWDEYKKEILSYSGGQSVTPMNKIKTVDKYLKDSWETTNPVIVHDAKHNEMLFNVVNDASLVYSEYAQQFISQYDVNIKHKLYFNETLVIVAPVKSSDPRIEKDALREWNCKDVDELKPYLKFVVNPNSMYNDTFDIMQIGGNLYKKHSYGTLNDISATFITSLKQKAILEPNSITDREYDYRLTIPRAGRYVGNPPHKRWIVADWGDRLRGKTMECELASNSDDLDFSLQYIITKYRKSWI